jgi:hypothetical protein
MHSLRACGSRAQRLRSQEIVEPCPSIRLAVTAALSRKECERTAGIIKAAVQVSAGNATETQITLFILIFARYMVDFPIAVLIRERERHCGSQYHRGYDYARQSLRGHGHNHAWGWEGRVRRFAATMMPRFSNIAATSPYQNSLAEASRPPQIWWYVTFFNVLGVIANWS